LTPDGFGDRISKTATVERGHRPKDSGLIVRVFFVGGIHGAGKTSLCKQLLAALPAEHATAGDLIRNTPGTPACIEKAVNNVPENQRRLLNALDARRATCTTLLLDGHFCLLNRDGEVQDISIEVFRTISPSAIVLVEDDPLVIQRRLQSRDGTSYTVQLISEFGRRELDHATAVSKTINVPLTRFRSGDSVGRVLDFLKISSAGGT
jgi:adenylate kinase